MSGNGIDMTGPEWDCAFEMLSPTKQEEQEENQRSLEILVVGSIGAVIAGGTYHYGFDSPKTSWTVALAVGGLLLGAYLYKSSVPKTEREKKIEACQAQLKASGS